MGEIDRQIKSYWKALRASQAPAVYTQDAQPIMMCIHIRSTLIKISPPKPPSIFPEETYKKEGVVQDPFLVDC